MLLSFENIIALTSSKYCAVPDISQTLLSKISGVVMGAKITYFVLLTDKYKCLSKWKRYGEYCYRVKRKEKTMEEASSICESYDGHLASIGSEKENEFVRGKLSNC